MSKSEQTKRGIARAFVSLVESQPLEKVNVSKLVDAMGINRKTFYYHFTDKTDLVIWTFRSALADALQERFERAIYMTHRHNIVSVWSDGREVVRR